MAAADADGNGLISKEEMPDLLKGRCLRILKAFFFGKGLVHGLFGRKNMACLFVVLCLALKKDLEHANFYLFFFVGCTTVTSQELDLKWT